MADVPAMSAPSCRHREVIPPVSEGLPRPLWSVMIPTYHCARYLREALRSVLVQAPGPELMQIEVIDDCSTEDDPAAVVADLGAGRVVFYRQPRNVGHVRNFNTCVRRARGRLVHLLHGDDSVRDGFYREMERAFHESPDIGAAFCRYIWMDQEGQWQYVSALREPSSGLLSNALERMAAQQIVQAPAMVVRREVYEKLGGFDDRLSWCGEDWEMWVRIAAVYPVWYHVEPLAAYRTHPASLARRSTMTGRNIRDCLLAIDIYRPYLPAPDADRIAGRAREHCALWALDIARRAGSAGDWRTSVVQMREAWRSRLSPVIVARMAAVVARLAWQWMLHAAASWKTETRTSAR